MGNDAECNAKTGSNATDEHPKPRAMVPSDDPVTETVDGVTYTNVLRVKADPPGTTDEERKRRIKGLAGAIAHGLRRFGEIHVRAIGKEATYKAVKAVIEASAFVAVHGFDLYTRPGYMMAGDVQGKDEMTGITFLVVTSQNRKDVQEEHPAASSGAAMERIAAREVLRRWVTKYAKTCKPGPWDYDRDAAGLCEDTAELLGLGDPWAGV